MSIQLALVASSFLGFVEFSRICGQAQCFGASTPGLGSLFDRLRSVFVALRSVFERARPLGSLFERLRGFFECAWPLGSLLDRLLSVFEALRSVFEGLVLGRQRESSKSLKSLKRL